jgi:hypothetical protein
MIYLLVLFPATALTVGGYVALFLAGRSEGRMRAFGKYLGYWVFTLAALLVLAAIFAAAHGGHRCPMWMHGMHERMHDSRPDALPAEAPPVSEAPGTAPNSTEPPAPPSGAPRG